MNHGYRARLIPADVPLVEKPKFQELPKGSMRTVYGGRPNMPCPGASLPLYEGGTRWERVNCTEIIMGETGDILCTSCATVERDARKRLRNRKEQEDKNARPKATSRRDQE